jgi:hypothetical protein
LVLAHQKLQRDQKFQKKGQQSPALRTPRLKELYMALAVVEFRMDAAADLAAAEEEGEIPADGK